MLDCYHKCMSYLPKDKKIVARRIYCVKTVIISNDKNLTTGENGYTVTGVSNCSEEDEIEQLLTEVTTAL